MTKFFVSLVLCSLLSAQQKHSVSELAWFTGQWEFIKGDSRITEVWLPPSGNTMMGTSKTVSGEKTTEYEFVIIERDSVGDIMYHAHPSGQFGASFRLVKLENKAALFENLHHDFPQRIGYVKMTDDSLFAYIEGTIMGKYRRMEFPYKKKQ